MNRTCRRELLERLLSKYERGGSFRRPAPWPRDVILRIDGEEFPRAFSADGREELADLCAAARELARQGALRITFFKGLPEERPREVRLGPAEVERAYEAAGEEGFRSLGEALNALEFRVQALLSPDLPVWMRLYLEGLAADVGTGKLSLLGMSRERFKREQSEVLDSLSAAAALARGATGWERVLSERIFADSKRLGSVRGKTAEILLRADPRWEGVAHEDSLDLLETYGVRRKPGLIRCAGKAVIRVAERSYFLEDFTPTAHLPEDWVSAWSEGITDAAPQCITTVENEYPFLSYVLEAGGPRGLASRGELVVYTAGFPSTALMDGLVGIRLHVPSVFFRHWGDADVGGLRIWWLLRTRLATRVDLFRTRSDWLETEARRGRDLNDLEKRGLENLRRELLCSVAKGDSDVTAAIELIDALIRTGKKVEQERW